MALTKARLLKHDFPVHGNTKNNFWGGGFPKSSRELFPAEIDQRKIVQMTFGG